MFQPAQQGTFATPDTPAKAREDHCVELQAFGFMDCHQLQLRPRLRIWSSIKPGKQPFQGFQRLFTIKFFQQCKDLIDIQQVCLIDAGRTIQRQPG